MTVEATEQLAMDEQRRQKAKDALVEPRKDFKSADEQAKAALERLELPEGHAARVGRFRIEHKVVAEHDVSFHVEEKSQLKIGLIADAE